MTSRGRSALKVGVAIVVAVLSFGSDPALAIGLQGTYSEWQLPPSTTGPYTGYYNVDSNLYVAADPVPHRGQSSPYWFYSHQFGAVSGAGGYIGLQVDPGLDGMQRKVIWSWWDAVASSCDTAGGSVCGPFSGAECCGHRILLPYNWRAGKYYRLRISLVGDQPDGTREWVATVRESDDLYGANAVERIVGRMRVPKATGWLSGYSLNWIEWYGPQQAECWQYPRSHVYWSPTSGNFGQAQATLLRNFYGNASPACPSRITNYGFWQSHEIPIA